MSQEVQVEIEMEELLSSEAFLCACEAAFREADENGDGVLQKSEVLASLEKHHEETAESLSGREKELFLSFRPDASVADEIFDVFDANHDGVLDLEEYLEYCRRLFRGMWAPR